MKIGVIGAGSWGTTLAKLLAEKGLSTTLWVFEKELIEEIKKKRINSYYLPDVVLPENLEFTNDLETAVKDRDIIVSVTPSHVVRNVMTEAVQFIKKGAVIVTASKGIENETLLTMSQVLEEVIPEKLAVKIVALSGPSFAKDVAGCLPTAVTIASQDSDVCKFIQNIFSTSYFRTYTHSDVLGVELGGALKNVIAISAGVSDGLGLGSSTRAALITRGLAEITRLGLKLGADARTFMGLSGIGDLVLTCTGDLSRNRTVGIRLGKGEKLKDILSSMRMVAEGVKTAKSAYNLSKKLNVEMPITEETYRILYEDKDAKDAVISLMKRELKSEMEGIN
jgi:glycerol-3-phosphate dehydrogenase (NAD(P)+)